MKISSLPHGCVGMKKEKPLDVPGWFDVAARRNPGGVEVMDQWVMEGLLEHVDRSLMADIQKGLASQPLEASALINHGPHVWPSSKKNDRETDKAKSFMDWAAELGAQIFRVTIAVLDPEARFSESEVRRIFCEMIEKLLPHAKARGLSIGLEEHPGFAGTVAKMQKDTGTHFGSQFWHCFRYEEHLERGPESFVNLEAKGRFEPGSIYAHADNFRRPTRDGTGQ